ncbi:DUF4160 domain-containing protein [Hathewaya limosa]|uniref:DUF4160 domain-containing protein n=1 Tax=Hathewaya limosa TaxID=1536 RepID=A0ABU0JXQ2_HATLI|nr:DUF4160 domain-containing protein [Hathewaya limosa]AWZ49898.1 DUF4160 domain-containing protein [Clostridiaceae bacterium 14S0207]MDQ0480687.1 hypothetical protein [Hathewaya limosa]
MPEISLFFGIRVTINYNDHVPPHFHAEYNGNKVLVDIINCKVLKGYLPKRQLKLILAWTEIHKDELMQNWELARNQQPLYRIAPLS